MKISNAIFLVFFLTAITSLNVFAEVKPDAELPEPNNAVATTNALPGDPDLPIDQNLEYLILSGLLLGAGFIYKDKIKKSFSS